jgi:hypothetical protein
MRLSGFDSPLAAFVFYYEAHKENVSCPWFWRYGAWGMEHRV